MPHFFSCFETVAISGSYFHLEWRGKILHLPHTKKRVSRFSLEMTIASQCSDRIRNLR